MSLQISVQLRDQVSAQLALLRSKLSNLAPVNRSIGTAVVALAKRTFDEPDLRATPWASKKDGSVATLKYRNLLVRSPRVVTVTSTAVSIGSDRPYAAIHQLGGQTRPHVIRARRGKAITWPGARHPVRSVRHPGSKIPPRPFFPVTKAGELTAAAVRATGEVLAAYLRR